MPPITPSDLATPDAIPFLLAALMVAPVFGWSVARFIREGLDLPRKRGR